MDVLTDTWSAWWKPGWNTTWARTGEANARKPMLTKMDVASVLRNRVDFCIPFLLRGVDFRGIRDVVAHAGLSAERSAGRWSDRQSLEVTVENQSDAPLHSAQPIASRR